MIYATCRHCHKRHPVGAKCNCIVSRSIQTAKSKDTNDFYSSNQWRKLRSVSLAKTYGLDIYTLYTEHRLEQARPIHHIVPIEDDKTLSLCCDNLIPLSDHSHRLIHSIYDSAPNAKLELQQFLRKLLAEFQAKNFEFFGL